MRIENVELRTIALRLKEPFRISSGMTQQRQILLVRMEADGVAGWGECVAGEAPYYSYETVDTARLVIERYLLPVLLGNEFADAVEVDDALGRAVRGHRMARAALEMAAWDVDAQLRGVSLGELLGGTRAAVEAGVSIGIQPDVDALLGRVATFKAAGYRRIKVKIAPGWDVDVVAAVRARFPDTPLMVDANAAYDTDDVDRLRELDAFGLTMIEQPFAEDRLLAHARLQERLATPVCLDESVTGAQRCEEAIELKSCRVVNIKPGRVGGHAESKRIHDLCAAAGIPVWCGGMLESGIGRAHNVALASLPNFRLPGDTSASGRYWERDVVVPEFVLDGEGCVAVPQGVGLGVEVDDAFLEAVTVALSRYAPAARPRRAGDGFGGP